MSRLTLEEVDALAYGALAGEKDAMSRLSEALIGIAEALAAKRRVMARIRGVQREDMVQQAMLEMLEALPKWNPEKGQRFRSFAYDIARYAILDTLNTAHVVSVSRNMAGVVHEETVAPSMADREGCIKAARLALQPTIPISTFPYEKGGESATEPGTEEEGYEEVETRVAAEHLMRKANLPQSQYDAVLARFSREPASVKRLAQKQGVCDQAIRQRADRAVDRMRMGTGLHASRKIA